MDRGYSFVVERIVDEDGGGWRARVADLPGISGDGDTPEAALEDAMAAVESYVLMMEEMGREVPPPPKATPSKFSGKLMLRMTKRLHSSIARLAEAEGVSQNYLISTLLAEAIGERKIDDKDGRAA